MSSNSEINFNDFVKFVHQNFEERISLTEVEEIIRLEEDYNRDSPTSSGKYLHLNRLIFSGKKISGEEFKYDQKFSSGINLWIADNMKGKSTIFKIIKYALTGADSIKPDIRKWIEEIILEFQIGKAVFTIYINKSGRDSGALYSFDIAKFLELRGNQKLDTIEKEKEFDFKSKTQLEEKLQEFFFEHFAFYVLKYTQKNSSKESFELSTANLSWATYFKSIYLESSNYKFLFFAEEHLGAQGRKIFEMILGLRLTYPINMLTVQRDKVSEEIGKLKIADRSKSENTKSQKDKIERAYNLAKENLKKVQAGSINRYDEKPLVDEYNTIQQSINDNRKKTRSAKEAYDRANDKLSSIQDEVRNLEQDEIKIREEIGRLLKLENQLELYKESESFFSNLDIKVCPHCEIEVNETKRQNERTNHVCSLCGEIALQPKIEDDEILTKVSRVKGEVTVHEKKLKEITALIARQKNQSSELLNSAADLYSKLVALPSVESDLRRLKELEENIDTIVKERENQNQLYSQREELIKQEAVLKYQLEEIEKESSTDSVDEIAKLNLKREILEFALLSLEKKRLQMNKDLIEKLEQLILNEIHEFGLTSINKIKISDKYELLFTQHEVTVNFSELTEGEKLRVKLAFYLSLIQLDIEHSLGRHPRFLIFDSPGGEEMIEQHLHGLSDFLKNVNQRHGKNLQIFVGSALRDFSQITETEKAIIKEKDEFVF